MSSFYHRDCGAPQSRMPGFFDSRQYRVLRCFDGEYLVMIHQPYSHVAPRIRPTVHLLDVPVTPDPYQQRRFSCSQSTVIRDYWFRFQTADLLAQTRSHLESRMKRKEEVATVTHHCQT